MRNENNRRRSSHRSLRRDVKLSRRHQKEDAQITDMDKRMEDAFLSVRALKGDGSAFALLTERYSEAVRNYIAARLFPELWSKDLEDVCQDAWVLIWKKLHQYDPWKASFQSFAKYWAGIAWLRWLAQRSLVERFVAALMEHRRRYPEMESEELDQLENLVHIQPFDEWWDREALAAKADTTIGQILRTRSNPMEILSVLLALFQEWQPRRIAARLSRETLWSVTNLVARQMRRETHLPKERIKAHFDTLRKLLRAKVEDILKGQRYERLRRRHHGARVGDLRVRAFYTGRVKGGRAAEIVKWRSAAVTRVRQLACIRLAAEKTGGTRRRRLR